MSATFEAIFNALVDTRKVTLRMDRQSANSLRTSLLRKWKSYKDVYERLGFLPEEYPSLSLGMTYDEDSGIATYSLHKKVKRTYAIILESTSHSTDIDTGITNHG